MRESREQCEISGPADSRQTTVEGGARSSSLSGRHARSDSLQAVLFLG